MKNDDEMLQSILSRWDEYREKRKRRIRMAETVASVTACLCLAVSFGSGFFKNYADLPKIAVVQDITSPHEAESTAPSHTPQSGTAVSSRPTVSTTVAPSETYETQPPMSDTYEYEQSGGKVYEKETPAHTRAPVNTQAPSKTEPTAAAETHTTQTDAPEVTETTRRTMPHLLASDDPITNFPVISYDGKDYEGYRYITAERFSKFYICWTEETVLNTFSENRGMEVTEPAVINGLRDKEFDQEYIIICFKDYNMYGLYGAVEEEQPSEEQSDNTTLIDNE